MVLQPAAADLDEARSTLIKAGFTDQEAESIEDGIHVVNVKTFYSVKGSLCPIHRPYPLGNPYEVDKHGRDDAIRLFDENLGKQISAKRGTLYNSFMSLVRRFENGESLLLGCYCAPSKCHGNVIRRRILETADLSKRSSKLRSSNPLSISKEFDRIKWTPRKGDRVVHTKSPNRINPSNPRLGTVIHTSETDRWTVAPGCVLVQFDDRTQTIEIKSVWREGKDPQLLAGAEIMPIAMLQPVN